MPGGGAPQRLLTQLVWTAHASREAEQMILAPRMPTQLVRNLGVLYRGSGTAMVLQWRWHCSAREHGTHQRVQMAGTVLSTKGSELGVCTQAGSENIETLSGQYAAWHSASIAETRTTRHRYNLYGLRLAGHTNLTGRL
jgi:hypothetical protein